MSTVARRVPRESSCLVPSFAPCRVACWDAPAASNVDVGRDFHAAAIYGPASVPPAPPVSTTSLRRRFAFTQHWRIHGGGCDGSPFGLTANFWIIFALLL